MNTIYSKEGTPKREPKKRIGLFLSANPYSGGAFQYGRAILEAAAFLPRERFEVVAGYTASLWKPYLKEYDLPTFFIHLGRWSLLRSKRLAGYIPIKWWRSHALSFHSIANQLAQKNCSLWVFPSQDTWTYLLPFASLGTVYDLMHRYERRFREASGYGLYRCRERHYQNICRWAKGILVDSEVGKRHVMESYGVHPEMLHILPFIPPPQYFHPERLAKGSNESYHLPEKFLFYPAQFWEHKNHKGLVKAAAVLKDEIPDLQLVFVGSRKNGYQSTSALVKDLGLHERVHFLGYVPDANMPELYRRARAMIMPTFFGPTNIPPLEAMALGCPVAISLIYGMPEQLGDAALFFNPSSVHEIARVMKRLWQDDKLCDELSRRGLFRSMQWNQTPFSERFQQIVSQVLMTP